MLLIDATGYGDNNRFQHVNEGVELLLQGLDNTALINKNVGNGVVNHLQEELGNRHISFSDLRCANISDADAFFIAQSDLCDRELLVIDDAQELDRLPEIVKVLQGFEEGGIKLLYVVTVPTEKLVLAEDQFIIAAGNRTEEPVEVPQATKDRFIHVELKIEGPAPGQSMRSYLMQNAGLTVE